MPVSAGDSCAISVHIGANVMLRNTRKYLVFVFLILTICIVGYYARTVFDIEMNPDSLRAWINEAGPAAPAIAILLVGFRMILGIPSHLALLVVGLCFGVFKGAIYGAMGLAITGMLTFLIARYGAREFVKGRISKRFELMMNNAGNRSGAVAIAILTAYPIGPLTPVHTLAGVTPMPALLFFMVLSLGSLVRAACYTYFGSSLITGGIQPIIEASALLLSIICLPLLFPKCRAWLKQWALETK
jgi:uncharacterized membrane protein YdjX (TVP38/TMEM64 family)